VFDTSDSLRPRKRLVGHIAPVLRSEAVDRWALSPSGDVLAATDGDRIFLIPANHLRAGAYFSPRALRLSPEGQPGEIDELLFAPDGDSLWAMSTSTAYEARIRGAGSDSLALELARTLPRNESPWPVALPGVAQP
jgi:hypothetical protein